MRSVRLGKDMGGLKSSEVIRAVLVQWNHDSTNDILSVPLWDGVWERRGLRAIISTCLL